jgi:hypothetical protein
MPGFPNHRLRSAELVFRRDRRAPVALHELLRTPPYDYRAICKTTGAVFNVVRSLFEYRRCASTSPL